MAHRSDSIDDDFVAHFEARAVGLVKDATAHEPRVQRDACRCLGMMKYDAERATRDNDNRTVDECTLYDASCAALLIVNAFIDIASEDQLRFVWEGMLHGQNIHNLLQEPHATQTLSDIDSLIAQADANRMRTIIAGFVRSVHT